MARHFTLEEATALLPEITPMLKEIVTLRARLEQAEQGQASHGSKARTNGHVDPRGATAGRSARAELVAAISVRMARLHELGVELKDPRIGLIDFPAWRDDRVVLLCWKLGEPAIAYWHEIDAGYAGRQRL